VALALSVDRGGAEDKAFEAALARVSGAAVRAHVEFLADDLLEGRDTGTRGYDLAARYVATQLALLGLAPAGDDGTFFQQVPLVETRLVDGSLSLADGSGTAALVRDQDFVMGGDSLRAETAVTAPVVFVGFGVTAPKQRYDDYAGASVKGKVVALLSNAPARFPSEERAYHSSRSRKAENAAAHGAVGVLMIRTPEEEARTPWARILGFADGPSYRWTRPDGTPDGVFPELRGSAMLNTAATKRLFAASPVPLDQVFARAEKGPFPAVPLGVTATFSSRSEHRQTRSPNVVGLLEGSDPKLRSSYVVYSAHLDHVGVRSSGEGDRIHNGAYDNALGSAVVLEVARTLASLQPRPRRSVLFLFVTAEEKGLVGSDYFAARPSVAGSLAANVNIDMPLALFPIADVVAFGAENSTLEAKARAAAASVGLSLSPDPMPEETIFVRSDQYSFVRRGVPAVMFSPGMRSADPGQDGRKLFMEFIGRHYHRPTDDVSLPMDRGSIERFTKANIALGYAIAQDPAAPAWKPGNFFGETFGPK
jgi:hypothetical protein